MSKKDYKPEAETLPPYEPPPMTDAEKAAAQEAADAAEQAPKPEMPERFYSGGATAEEIAAWKAEHGC